MSGYGLVELGLVFGVVLLWGLWEIYSVRKQLRASREENEDRHRKS